MTIYELQEKRQPLVAQQRALAASVPEGEQWPADKVAQYDELERQIGEIEKQIIEHQADLKRRESIARREAELAQPRETAPRPQLATQPRQPAESAVSEGVFATMQRLMAEGAGRREAVAEAVRAAGKTERGRAATQVTQQFIALGRVGPGLVERAGLQMDSDTGGGVLVVPEDFVAQLIKGLDAAVFMRGISTVLPLTNAESLGVPTLENNPADADWTVELAIGGTDTTMSFGKRALHPHPVGKLLKVSKTLLRKSAIPVDALVRDRLQYKFAVTEEKGYLTGTGTPNQQPLGVFTASADGITTGRDVSTGNTTTAITADGLIECKYSLASQYLMSANLAWIFHRTAVKNIRKLKDGNGQYLWQAGLGGTPDTILDIPYYMSEYAPSTFTTGLYVGILGDFQYYWIAEALRFELQRLDELYATTNEVGFIGRMELDAMPVLAEAFARVKLA